MCVASPAQLKQSTGVFRLRILPPSQPTRLCQGPFTTSRCNIERTKPMDARYMGQVELYAEDKA